MRKMVLILAGTLGITGLSLTAMAQMVDDSVAPNTVVDELQVGYVLRDRLLRPARVVVSRRGDAGGGSGTEATG